MQKLFEGSRKIIYFSSGIKSANKISGKRVGISFATLNRKNLKTLEIGTKRAKPVIAISKDHPLTKKENLTLEDIKDETILCFEDVTEVPVSSTRYSPASFPVNLLQTS